MRRCQTLEEVTKAAVDLVDNCEFYEEGLNTVNEKSVATKIADLENQRRSIGQSKPDVEEQIIENVMRRINQADIVPSYRVPQLRRCMTCRGDHPTQQCPYYTPRTPPLGFEHVMPQPPRYHSVVAKQVFFSERPIAARNSYMTHELQRERYMVDQRPFQGQLQIPLQETRHLCE